MLIEIRRIILYTLQKSREKTILERQIEAAEALQPESIIFCIKEGEIKQYSTDGVISQLVTNAIDYGH